MRAQRVGSEIDSIPCEVLVAIFEYLDHREWSACQRVCRHWRAAANSGAARARRWEQVYFRGRVLSPLRWQDLAGRATVILANRGAPIAFVLQQAIEAAFCEDSHGRVGLMSSYAPWICSEQEPPLPEASVCWARVRRLARHPLAVLEMHETSAVLGSLVMASRLYRSDPLRPRSDRAPPHRRHTYLGSFLDADSVSALLARRASYVLLWWGHLTRHRLAAFTRFFGAQVPSTLFGEWDALLLRCRRRGLFLGVDLRRYEAEPRCRLFVASTRDVELAMRHEEMLRSPGDAVQEGTDFLLPIEVPRHTRCRQFT